MSLKWLFALGLIIYGFNAFSSEIEFNQIIEENAKNQLQLAADIQSQLGLNKQKTLKNLTAKNTVSFEGYNLKIISN